MLPSEMPGPGIGDRGPEEVVRSPGGLRPLSRSSTLSTTRWCRLSRRRALTAGRGALESLSPGFWICAAQSFTTVIDRGDRMEASWAAVSLGQGLSAARRAVSAGSRCIR